MVGGNQMETERVRMPTGFGSYLTPLGKRLLLVYGSIYVLELLFEHWLNIEIVSVLKLYPLSNLNFHFWQLITHPFIHNPNSPISFIISCIIFYFFAAPVEHAFGPKRFAKASGFGPRFNRITMRIRSRDARRI